MNPFQAQYPLSPKKFLKKLIPTLFPSLVFAAILGGFAGGFEAILDASVSTIILTGILVALLSFIAIVVLYSWYFKAFIRSYYYEGGDNFITIRKGVFTPKEIHVQYAKIQDVYVDQDLLDRIMGLYDVHIASATFASGMEAHIDGVERDVAEGLKNFFLAKIQNPGGAAQSAAPGQPVGQPPSPSVVQFSEEISNETYPIQSAWLVKSALGAVFTSVFAGVIGGVYLVSDTRSGNPGLFAGHFNEIAIAIAVLWFAFHFIGLLIWKANYRFAFTPEYIQYATGILARSEQHIPYRSIQDVNISQSLLDRIFGLANVRIENAAQMQSRRAVTNSGISIVGQNRERADRIVAALKPVILSANSSQTGV